MGAFLWGNYCKTCAFCYYICSKLPRVGLMQHGLSGSFVGVNVLAREDLFLTSPAWQM